MLVQILTSSEHRCQEGYSLPQDCLPQSNVPGCAHVVADGLEVEDQLSESLTEPQKTPALMVCSGLLEKKGAGAGGITGGP